VYSGNSGAKFHFDRSKPVVRPAFQDSPKGVLPGFLNQSAQTAPTIRRKPPEGPEHPSLWLFFSSQAPHLIETVPLENRRQASMLDS